MQKKTTLHYYKPGDFYKLEAALDAMSKAGWQAVRPGRLLQKYVFDNSAFYYHRFGCCTARPGSAGEISYLAAQKLAGWEVAARKKCWILFRKPVSDAQASPRLEEDRQPIAALFSQKIKRLEAVRRWMLVLASILLIVGYAANLIYILYSFALPMLVMLLITLQIKYMEEGLKH